ncbi:MULTISPECIES: aldehyde dehydrogenase family protein [unclassified Auritidibacter]|uniref:aldehyde dehydrogenase family protein n=1 Tax=unclassified Auritidibacter TaxID=2634694 RepID=UPI000D725B63|nr:MULTISPECIES: aldehyde dehydrogenase family protein [unclassified Auritidibacter]AXR75181.1 aldehyde dehydrogenase family protein [Auritidibacter sp. NML130574]PXA76902.1 aldehyde dehydrogenase [Auritidibacter sp. NML100628]
MTADLTTYQGLLEAVTVDGGVEVKDPATAEVIGSTGQASVDDVDAAVQRAKRAQPAWAALGGDKRSEYLNRVADAVEASAEALAELLSREVGKPLNGPNARFEVGAVAGWLRATASFELNDEVLVDDESGTAVLSYRPVGVVGAVGPWNWPMMISTWQFGAALKMGNTVVLKPSEYTPLSVQALVAVVNQVLPEAVLQVVAGGGEIGAALTEHQDVDKVMFTGSTRTGQAIMRSAATDLKRLTLELGGNDAGIMLDDADPKALAEELFWGAFINTGQTCAAMKRLYVPEALYDQVVDELAQQASNVAMGVGLEEHNVLGPLQNQQQYDIVADLVNKAREGGARMVTGGNPDPDQAGYFYPATIVADIDQSNPLVQEEQFGPVLPVIRYTDLDQAIAWANELNVGLGSSVWSSDRQRALTVADRLQAGTTWINQHGAIDPRVPFGGIKKSGFGLEFGVEGLKHVAVPKVTKY